MVPADATPEPRPDPRTLRLLRQRPEAEARGGRPPVLGPHAAPGLRPRAADERRLPPAQGLPDARPTTTASCENMRLADGSLWPMPDHARRLRGLRRQGRARPGHRAARPRGRDPRDPVGHRQVDARQGPRGEERLRRRRPRPPGGELPAPQGRPGLSRRPGHGHPAARALRLPGPPRHAERAARLLPQARLAARRRVPDPQPAAPRASGADLPRRPGGAGEPADPPGRRHDQARRHRPLHPRALLRGGARPLPGRDHDAVPPATSRCAWAARARRSGTASSAATTAAPT